MTHFIFWTALFFILYPYIGYPILLWLKSRFKQQPINKVAENYLPNVSIVMAVKDGEKVIERRLKNFLSLDYAQDKLEIIAVSDGSSDSTNEILRKYVVRYPGIFKSVIYSPSKGKPYALNKGVGRATGKIILFADSRQIFEPDVVKELVANFHDDNIGCASGELCFKEDLGSEIEVEMGAYWKYEKWIRKLESSTGSVVGATGAIYAIRKELYKPLPVQTLLDDVLTPMNIVIQGYRVVFEPDAIAYDTVSKDLSQERKRKLRTLAGNWQLINLASDLFKPWKNPIWFRFISHKICRLIVPFLLPVLLIVSLLGQPIFYQFVAWVQIILYCIGCLGFVPQLRTIKIVHLVYFFLIILFFLN